MQVLEELKGTQVFVEKHLRKFFQEKGNSARKVDPSCVVLVEQVVDLTLRPAKRIRPFLVWLGFGGRLSPRLAPAMLAVELFHTFALIHDDIMDQDSIRRGGPTIHKKFNPKHFGISVAILAGDLALVWADELINSTQNKKAIRLFGEMKEEVAFGQTLDVMKQGGYKNISQDKINELKTAWYTVVRPLQVGAALAGAKDKTLTELAGYGVPVGKLFQLKDDLMDGEVTQSDFNRQTHELQREAIKKLPAKNKELFLELVRFVVERTF